MNEEGMTEKEIFEQRRRDAMETSKMMNEIFNADLKGTSLIEDGAEFKAGIIHKDDGRTRMFVEATAEDVIHVSSLMGYLCEHMAIILGGYLEDLFKEGTIRRVEDTPT